MAPAAVGAYIGAAYWFTSSTSFANPAVTIGRAFTDTFAGIAPVRCPASSSPSSSAAWSDWPSWWRSDPRALPAADNVVGPTASTSVTRDTAEQSCRDKPSVLFVCVHNAGRSQMAAGWLRHLAGDAVEVRSAGSEPADHINPAAVAAMARSRHRHHRRVPRSCSTDDTAFAADVIITMGCGDACPIFPGKRYEDWKLDDPAGQGVDAVRPIRDEIEERVRVLVAEILPPATST